MDNNKGRSLYAELRKERDKVKKLNDMINELMSEEGLYERIKDNKAIKQRIIAEYLKSLSDNNTVSLISGGLTALTPVNRPKNLQDAKRLADKIIKS